MCRPVYECAAIHFISNVVGYFGGVWLGLNMRQVCKRCLFIDNVDTARDMKTHMYYWLSRLKGRIFYEFFKRQK